MTRTCWLRDHVLQRPRKMTNLRGHNAAILARWCYRLASWERQHDMARVVELHGQALGALQSRLDAAGIWE